jgi:hypothetical protein
MEENGDYSSINSHKMEMMLKYKAPSSNRDVTITAQCIKKKKRKKKKKSEHGIFRGKTLACAQRN